jgi:subtilase family serine protease
MRIAKQILILGTVGAIAWVGARPHADAGIVAEQVKPDLIVESAYAVTPYLARVTIRNIGFVQAGASHVSLSILGVSGSSTTAAVPAVPAWQSRVVYVATTKPLTKPGQTTLFRADFWNAVTESKETNNTRYWTSPPA